MRWKKASSKQDDIELIERKGHVKNPRTERIPQPSSDCSGSDLFAEYKEVCQCGGSVQDDRDGFLGKS